MQVDLVGREVIAVEQGGHEAGQGPQLTVGRMPQPARRVPRKVPEQAYPQHIVVVAGVGAGEPLRAAWYDFPAGTNQVMVADVVYSAAEEDTPSPGGVGVLDGSDQARGGGGGGSGGMMDDYACGSEANGIPWPEAAEAGCQNVTSAVGDDERQEARRRGPQNGVGCCEKEGTPCGHL